jgi:hypothetical protein
VVQSGDDRSAVAGRISQQFLSSSPHVNVACDPSGRIVFALNMQVGIAAEVGSIAVLPLPLPLASQCVSICSGAAGVVTAAITVVEVVSTVSILIVLATSPD